MTTILHAPEGAEQRARQHEWAGTMSGFSGSDVRLAHHDSHAVIGEGALAPRAVREHSAFRPLAPGATAAVGAGDRARPEAPDPLRTSFERDRDRILHSAAFRRLAGKTQVFIFPADHQRTRLTHALEVAQVARAIAEALSLNVALAEAIALGHDCGHGPGGHPSEEAFAPYLDGGYDHAVFGADVVLAPLNLTREVLDGVRNHSWSRPAPKTPEGEVVSWADRIAYVCHDFEDAVSAAVVRAEDLPESVAQRGGARRGEQLGVFIESLVHTSAERGEICMDLETADALRDFRRFNYERIYLRDASLVQYEAVISLLRRLVEHFIEFPREIPGLHPSEMSESELAHSAVAYVGGMTDRFAFDLARSRLDYDEDLLPRGVDWSRGR